MRYFDYVFVTDPTPYTLQGLGAAAGSYDSAAARYKDVKVVRQRVWDLISPNMAAVPKHLRTKYNNINDWITKNEAAFIKKGREPNDRGSGWSGWEEAADLAVWQFSELSSEVDTAIKNYTGKPVQSANVSTPPPETLPESGDKPPSPGDKPPPPPPDGDMLKWAAILGIGAFFLWKLNKDD